MARSPAPIYLGNPAKFYEWLEVLSKPANDLGRLGLSLASAARGSDLPGVATARMSEQMILGQEQAFTDANEGTIEEIVKPDFVDELIAAMTETWTRS